MHSTRLNSKSTAGLRASSATPGFTLVEVLVAVAVIGLLVALLLPAVQHAREAARRTACSSNLRQIGVALAVHHDARGHYPVGCLERRPFRNTTARQLAWNVYLLPQVEQAAVWDAFDTSLPFDSAANRPAASQAVPVFLCPSATRFDPSRSPMRTDRGLGATDYGGMFGAMGMGYLPGNGVMRFEKPTSEQDVKDGLTHTIIVAEDTGRGSLQDAEWANGENIFDVTVGINRIQHNEIWSDHAAGAQVLFCGGAVKMLAEATSLEVLQALCTRSGREMIAGEVVMRP